MSDGLTFDAEKAYDDDWESYKAAIMLHDGTVIKTTNTYAYLYSKFRQRIQQKFTYYIEKNDDSKSVDIDRIATILVWDTISGNVLVPIQVLDDYEAEF